MIFKIGAYFDKEEKDVLIKANNIIQNMMDEMESTGLELYQDYDLDEWRDIKNKLKDLTT